MKFNNRRANNPFYHNYGVECKFSSFYVFKFLCRYVQIYSIFPAFCHFPCFYHVVTLLLNIFATMLLSQASHTLLLFTVLVASILWTYSNNPSCLSSVNSSIGLIFYVSPYFGAANVCLSLWGMDTGVEGQRGQLPPSRPLLPPRSSLKAFLTEQIFW